MRHSSTKEQRKAVYSQLIYIILNIVMAIAVLVSVYFFSAPVLSLFLVVLSKWRVFAVKPRFWWVNIQSNLIDFIVGLGFVAWLIQIGNTNLFTQAVLTIVYIGWLLLIKPRSTRKFVIAQGLISMYVGLSALAVVSYDWDILLVVASAMIIGFSVSRHILGDYELNHANHLARIWAVVIGEVTWVYSHWLITYPISFLNGFRFVQPAISMTLLTFLAWKVFDFLYQSKSSDNNQNLDFKDLKLPIIFTIGIILLMLIFFSRPLSGNI